VHVLAASLDRVQKDSAMLGLKPSVVRWVPGYFNESLPALVRSKPTLHFAVVRLDGDTYDRFVCSAVLWRSFGNH
jgi:hypothetical protein